MIPDEHNSDAFVVRSADGNQESAAMKQAVKAVLPSTIREILLTPWRRFYWWRKYRINPRKNRRLANDIISRNRPVKLELGSAKRPGMEDWIASDINGGGDIKLDLTQPLPFPESSIQLIYMSHVLEHFSYPSPMLDLLRECRRILKPQGVLSIAVPDARIFLNAYFKCEPFDKDKFCNWDVGLTYKAKIDYVNFIAYMGGEHKHLFDEENVLHVLLEAGFRDVRIREFDAEIDLHVRHHESIYATAAK